ncbi:hypothetical protein EDD22DRAFT_905794 [Suillus occidentalis]|nr:hypothetical protein EDD22DRAFT_905794 [Suillus occidentalis]
MIYHNVNRQWFWQCHRCFTLLWSASACLPTRSTACFEHQAQMASADIFTTMYVADNFSLLRQFRSLWKTPLKQLSLSSRCTGYGF